MPRAASSNRITIEFKPKGEKELLAAISALSASTNTLSGSQKKLGASIGLTEKAQKKQIQTGIMGIRNQRNMNKATAAGATKFSVFRSKLLLATFAVSMYAMTIGRLMKLYQEQEASERRLAAAIKSTGGAAGLTATEIEAMTASLERTGVVGDETNNKVAGLLLTFTNIGGPTFERTLKAVNDMAIGMNQGIPEFEQLRTVAIQLGKALQEPDKQYNALRKSGFSFSAAQVEIIKSSMEAGDILTAQNIILEAAETQFGGLSETMRETTAGAFQALGMAAGTFGEGIGEHLAPSMTKLANALEETFIWLNKNNHLFLGFMRTMKQIIIVMGAWKLGLMMSNLWTIKNFWSTSAWMAVLTSGKSLMFTAAGALMLLNSAMIKSNQTTEKKASSTGKMNAAVQETNKELEKLLDKLEKEHQKLLLTSQAKRLALQLENAVLFDLETTERRRLINKQKEVEVEARLLQIDVDLREAARERIVRLVNEEHRQENLNFQLKERIRLAKELLEEEEKDEKLWVARREVVDRWNVAMAKQHFLGKKDMEAQHERIDLLVLFNNQLKAATGDGLEGFRDMLFETDDVASLTFEHLEGWAKGFAEWLRDAIVEEGNLEAALKSLGIVVEELTMSQKFAANETVMSLQMVFAAATAVSAELTQLTEARMQREMEALKASADYEKATQEEREIMQNRIEQKYKSERKRNFKITKATNIANATMNIAAAVARALDLPTPLNFMIAKLVGALGAIQIGIISKQPAPKFATGGSFITSGATPIVVGESGAEKVSIEPLGGRARQTSGTSSNITINVSAPLVDETILDVIIPKIEEAGKLNLA